MKTINIETSKDLLIDVSDQSDFMLDYYIKEIHSRSIKGKLEIEKITIDNLQHIKLYSKDIVTLNINNIQNFKRYKKYLKEGVVQGSLNFY